MRAFLFLLAAGCSATQASSSLEPGSTVPDFALSALDGARHTLAEHSDKTVVLEWFNPGCPFVKHAHEEGGALRDLAQKSTEQGVVWLAINSGAPGKQGHGVELNAEAAKEWGMTHPVLIDEDGAVGKAFGAVTTPHMYVIQGGTLVYAGAIDNAPLGKAKGKITNYVVEALADLAAGREVRTPRTKPYGCSVKYGS